MFPSTGMISSSLHQYLTTTCVVLVIILALSTTMPTTIASGQATFFTASTTAKPDCQPKCGSVTIPYPFGIVDNIHPASNCSIDPTYSIICNTSFSPPKPFLNSSNIFTEILNISDTQMRIRNQVAYECYNSSGIMVNQSEQIRLSVPRNLAFSATANMLTVIGCEIIGQFSEVFPGYRCVNRCSKESDITNTCDSRKSFDSEGPFSYGSGCCQQFMPKGFTELTLNTVLTNLRKNSTSDFDPCGYLFVADKDIDRTYRGISDLNNPKLIDRIVENVPVVLDWAIGLDFGETCNRSSIHACQSNSSCIDGESGGYNCKCLPGYEGNPYLHPGCSDIDECADSNNNPCFLECINNPGNYSCPCPHGFSGDGRKNGTSCTRNPAKFPVVKLAMGLSVGFLSLVIGISWIYFGVKRRKIMKMREKFFRQNGGFLLEQRVFSGEHSVDSTKIFSYKELKEATNNFSQANILGRGGYGIVYKGILPGEREVAIKKAKLVDESQIEQFINEVVILTQVNHRNVVKLLGCCLEAEVPLLVYEFVSNGTLYYHIHDKDGASWLSWATCLRIATEAADALAYLHSAASKPIIHRDVKTSNILLDDHYVVKVSDFGASRLVPLDQAQVTTLVQGTLGYLDPEYFQSSQLTDKSDVYSFGVVLAELVTRQKPLASERRAEDRNLATYFINSVKEGRLFEIVEPQLLRDATKEQLVSMSELVKSCLSLMGEDRPTMKEVAIRLEWLQGQVKHPWVHETYEETMGLVKGDAEGYSVPSSTYTGTSYNSYDHSGQDSRSMEKRLMMIPISHPR